VCIINVKESEGMEGQSEDQPYSNETEETEKVTEEAINKSLASVTSRRRINEITIGAIAFLTLMALSLTDKIGVPPVVWFINELIRIVGIIFFIFMEHKAFEKALQKRFPLAFR
jgi:hypothetical protein